MHDGLDNTYYNGSIFSEGEGDRPIPKYSEMQLNLREKILYSIAELLALVFGSLLIGVPIGLACLPWGVPDSELNYTPFWVCLGAVSIVALVLWVLQLREIWGNKVNRSEPEQLEKQTQAT